MGDIALSMDRIAELLLSVETLKDVPRTGWILAGCDKNTVESVASHSWGVSFVTILLCSLVTREGDSIDSERALAMAVIHDIAEATTSDIPQRGGIPEWDDLRSAKERLENRVVAQVLQGTPIEDSVIQLMEEYQSAYSIEARVVRSADTIDMLVRAVRLKQRGVAISLLQQFFDSGMRRLRDLGVEQAVRLAEALAAHAESSGQ